MIVTGSSSNPINEPFRSDFGNVPSMSPDDVLEYVSNMLGDVDGRLLDFKAQAEKKIKMSNDERAWQNVIRMMGEGDGYTLGKYGTDAYKENAAAMKAELAKLVNSPNPDVKFAATNILAKINAYEADYKAWKADGKHGDPPAQVTWSQDVIDDAMAASTQRLQSFSSDNELVMMELGSLMQRRTQIVQFSSNVMGQLDRAMNSVVQNIGG